MKDRLGNLSWSVLGIAILLALVWLFGKLLLTSMKLAFLASLVLFTVWVVWPDAKVLTGMAEGTARRPWLVRLREHRWRPVPSPFGKPLPRPAAYAGILIGWWLLC